MHEKHVLIAELVRGITHALCCMCGFDAQQEKIIYPKQSQGKGLVLNHHFQFESSAQLIFEFGLCEPLVTGSNGLVSTYTMLLDVKEVPEFILSRPLPLAYDTEQGFSSVLFFYLHDAIRYGRGLPDSHSSFAVEDHDLDLVQEFVRYDYVAEKDNKYLWTDKLRLT